MFWNVRGLNSRARQRDVRAKIEESRCSIICLQETKCDTFDIRMIRSFCPRRFDQFAFSPSVGASGGILIIWNSSVFEGQLLEIQRYSVVVSFKSVHSSEKWTMVSTYGPCEGQPRDDFVSWLYHLSIPSDEHWLLLGDFNFIRSLDNRNQPGGDINDIFLFNEVIGHLGLLELPIKGRSFTWSNMQQTPLLEQLDWFFTTSDWISHYPNTVVFPLAKTASDHVPCVVSIDTNIPKSKVSRFENFWVDMPGFMDCVRNSWEAPVFADLSASAVLTRKFKRLRSDLRAWSKKLSYLKKLTMDCNKVIIFFDQLEEVRPLFRTEFNFRKIVKLHYEHLLKLHYIYWKQRCTIRYIKVGEENSKFFHAMASERMRKNSIASLKTLGMDDPVSDHDQM